MLRSSPNISVLISLLQRQLTFFSISISSMLVEWRNVIMLSDMNTAARASSVFVTLVQIVVTAQTVTIWCVIGMFMAVVCRSPLWTVCSDTLKGEAMIWCVNRNRMNSMIRSQVQLACFTRLNLNCLRTGLTTIFRSLLVLFAS